MELSIWNVCILIYPNFFSSLNVIDATIKPETFKWELSSKPYKDDSYDPYVERKVDHPLS